MAALNLGNMYLYGKGVDLDYEQAFNYFSKVHFFDLIKINDTSIIVEKANKGSNVAQFVLWKKYWYSDPEQSILWLKKSAESGNTEAQRILGEIYYTGNNIVKSYKQSEFWWLKAAEQGNVLSQSNLGCLYSDNDINYTIPHVANNESGGIKVSIDYVKALYWLNKASVANNYHAKIILADMYNFGIGVSIDYSKAYQYYKESAKNGDLRAQFNLGCMYDQGEGTNKDIKQAIFWFKKAAVNGYGSAQNTLASYYYFELQDYKNAFYWCEQAAEQGIAEAQYNLGLMYDKGDGVLKNQNQALYWHKKAAEQGIAEAQYSLGLSYLLKALDGNSTSNKKLAAYWIKKAYDNGIDKASELWDEYELWKYTD
jgi:TPR repeat protein